MEEEIQIFVPDSSYDNESLSGGEFKRELQEELEEFQNNEVNLKIKPILQANIGAGADWPAFLVEILPHVKAISPIALFFLGKKIDENIDAWLSIASKVLSLFKIISGWPNRAAAFLLALARINEKQANIQTVQILQYKAVDGHSEQNWRLASFDSIESIDNNLAEELVGGQIHFFRILVNDKEIEILIRGNEYELRVADD